jgi:hypothetical protein
LLSGVITSSHNALAARFDIPLTEKANVITTKDNQPLEATYMPDSKNVIEDFKSETGLEKTNQNENRDEDNPTNLTLEPLTTAETVPENEPLPNNQAGNYQGSPKNGTGNGVGNQYRFQGANGKKGNSHMISE